MKKLMLMSLVLLVGCSNDPIRKVTTDNPDLPVSVMCHVDGCTVYRLTDDGRHIYFAHCQSTSTASWTEPEGKANTRPMSVTTEEK